MLVIAVTGGIGSGKTTVSEIFKSKNIPIIDTDISAREIVESGKPAYKEVVKNFGVDILSKDKSINRQSLRQIIFSSDKKRLQLEKILHPIIWEEVKSQLSLITAPYCIVVVPLLLENISQAKTLSFDRILVIDIEEEMQISRIKKLANCNNSTIKNIKKSTVARQTRLDASNDIIVNSNNLDSLNEKIENLHKKYLKLAE